MSRDNHAGTDWRAAATAQLVTRLTAQADPATQAHWTSYLKGRARFRGVPMAAIRQTVRSVWSDLALSGYATDDLVELAMGWFAAETSEDKLAGILLLAEQLAPRLEQRHADALAAPLARWELADWNVVDWHATKAVHAFLTVRPDDLEQRARSVARWADSEQLWQRRAAVVSFAKLAPRPPFDGFVQLVLDACARNLVSNDRFAHTGPGWVLRELSIAAPDDVAAFIAAHPELSAEGRRMASARLRGGTYRRR
jgi:3-methyladenine DNA glycosylase AlkD